MNKCNRRKPFLLWIETVFKVKVTVTFLFAEKCAGKPNQIWELEGYKE